MLNNKEYKNFMPQKLNIPQKINYSIRLSEKALLNVGSFGEIISHSLVDEKYMMHFFMRKEAETSSRIEGTRITFEEMLLGEDRAEGEEQRSFIREAVGVERAIIKGNELIQEDEFMPNKVILSMHKSMMQYARNEGALPGKFRTKNVRVGGYLKSPDDYLPPDFTLVEQLMNELEQYIKENEINIPYLVKIAIIHAQFERIHPFRDGNGRIGRLLISFLLKKYGITSDVSFFVSPYIEKYKRDYYSGLKAIENNENGWNLWVEFFLSVCNEFAKDMKVKVNNLDKLYTDASFLQFTTKNSQHIKNFIFQNPIFTVPQVAQYFKDKDILSRKDHLYGLLNKSKDLELREGRGQRSHIYSCPKLFNLMNDF